MFQTKVVERIITHLFNNAFSENHAVYVIKGKNMVFESDMAQMRRE